MSDVVQKAAEQFKHCCVTQRRYRVAWLVGPVYSRKSTLARELCTILNWQYLDYTLTPGHFDALGTSIATYQPHQLTAALLEACKACSSDVLIVDELDGLLATWTSHQQLVWASQISRLSYLPHGIVLVTHCLTSASLLPYLPDKDQRYCFDINGVP